MDGDTSQIWETDTRREIRREIEQLASSLAEIYDLFNQVTKTLEIIDSIRTQIFKIYYAPKCRDLLTVSSIFVVSIQ